MQTLTSWFGSNSSFENACIYPQMITNWVPVKCKRLHPRAKILSIAGVVKVLSFENFFHLKLFYLKLFHLKLFHLELFTFVKFSFGTFSFVNFFICEIFTMFQNYFHLWNFHKLSKLFSFVKFSRCFKIFSFENFFHLKVFPFEKTSPRFQK